MLVARCRRRGDIPSRRRRDPFQTKSGRRAPSWLRAGHAPWIGNERQRVVGLIASRRLDTLCAADPELWEQIVDRHSEAFTDVVVAEVARRATGRLHDVIVALYRVLLASAEVAPTERSEPSHLLVDQFVDALVEAPAAPPRVRVALVAA